MKKQLLESQKELLRIKLARVNQAKLEISVARNRIAEELGIPKQELDKWRISAELDYFEKPDLPNKKDKK